LIGGALTSRPPSRAPSITRSRFVAGARREGSGERFGHEVHGLFGVARPVGQVRKQGGGVTAIEEAERVGVLARRGKQRVVRTSHNHYPRVEMRETRSLRTLQTC
jgi:hypothetical protein